MKVEERQWENKVFGIELTAENEEEDRILRRFWKGGIEVNAITEREPIQYYYTSSLQLTFLDLVEK